LEVGGDTGCLLGDDDLASGGVIEEVEGEILPFHLPPADIIDFYHFKSGSVFSLINHLIVGESQLKMEPCGYSEA
jgi:hypothetical protein